MSIITIQFPYNNKVVTPNNYLVDNILGVVPRGAGQYQEGSKAVGVHIQRQVEMCSTAVVEGVHIRHSLVVEYTLVGVEYTLVVVVEHTLAVVGAACSLLYSR